MAGTVFDNLEFYRTVLEELPIGVYIVDRERRVRFWNRRAEQLTGHLAHEAMGQVSQTFLKPCDLHGQLVSERSNPLGRTLTQGHSQKFGAFFLHKCGHRVAMRVHCRAIMEHGETVVAAIVSFEECLDGRDDSRDPAMYGCLDRVTGIPSHLLTRAVLGECMIEMERSQRGFGLLRIRVLGLDEFREKHGMQSALPFLRTAALTLRHVLDPEIFVGRWGEDEFIVVLPAANPVTIGVTAESIWDLVTHSDVSWWGDHFSVRAVVMHAVAQPGDVLTKLLNGLEPSHAAATGRVVGEEGRGHGARTAASATAK
jgi:PAS domain S-box-containing protein